MSKDSLPLFLISGDMEGWSGPIKSIIVAAKTGSAAVNRVTFGSDSMVQNRPDWLTVDEIGTIKIAAAELKDPHPYVSTGFVICSI